MADTENESELGIISTPGGGREEVSGCASSRPTDDTSTGMSAEPLRRQWRDLLAYWLLGLCNNYGYVVMLSAAHDILSNDNNKKLADVSISWEKN
ncbi:hypothetical protein PR048_013893 [Dryococelus australis]|uniref:Battenin n=1 Tax=Dryococelus australis TaxID=614101 RepID=A0ABQ9HTQ2_9NEOP|nr:hypothetical protein PR048_013893 [Dryococelus australis]